MQETPDNLTLWFHPRGGVREDDSGGFEGGASLISTEHSCSAQPPWLQWLFEANSPTHGLSFLDVDVLVRYPSWNITEGYFISSPLVTRNSILIKKKRKENNFVFSMIAAFVSWWQGKRITTKIWETVGNTRARRRIDENVIYVLAKSFIYEKFPYKFLIYLDFFNELRGDKCFSVLPPIDWFFHFSLQF